MQQSRDATLSIIQSLNTRHCVKTNKQSFLEILTLLPKVLKNANSAWLYITVFQWRVLCGSYAAVSAASALSVCLLIRNTHARTHEHTHARTHAHTADSTSLFRVVSLLVLLIHHRARLRDSLNNQLIYRIWQSSLRSSTDRPLALSANKTIN